MPASWQAYPRFPISFPDGMTNTILVVEKYARCGQGGTIWGNPEPDFWQPVFAAWSTEPPQIKPFPWECDPTRASTPFVGGLNVALADGAVRQLSSLISPGTWWAACTPAGDEVLGGDW
jgi:hypothetical protein